MPVVRAAGGVVWRTTDGVTEVALVHRPRYDDWSLPKGKLEPGESELAAAVREVGEELGSEVVVSRRLTTVAYRVADDDKTVAFWIMRHVRGEFEASDEVDDVRWLPPKDAAQLLSYTDERAVLDEFGRLPLPDSVVVLVRHAKAGRRSEWAGDDTQRPLDASGVEQSRRLVAFLSHFGADRVVSAPPGRCVQTVAPFAAAQGLEVLLEPKFSDDDVAVSPTAGVEALRALARPGRVTVVASQGGAIPTMVEAIAPWVGSTRTRKSGAWVLGFVDGDVASTDYFPDAGRE